jgi:psp operon transcriptional activator
VERNTQLVGQSSSFLDAVERASRAAPLDRPVLVIGERGTGKELIAERLHHLSARWDGPLVAMNCAALPETLIEAELFGHEAGAFTGATKARAGRFEEADGGTLFLDELATLSQAAQERLLRVVEYGEVTRIGASRPLTVDVRIVAATNEHLQAVARGAFPRRPSRRLCFEVVTLPPLRHRAATFPSRRSFAPRMALELNGKRWPGFSNRVGQLSAYDCPATSANSQRRRAAVYAGRTGAADRCNPVRSLRIAWRPCPNRLKNCSSEVLRSPRRSAIERLRSSSCATFGSPSPNMKRRSLPAALEKCRWNQRAAAAALSLSYDQLRHAMKRHQLQG